MFKVLQIDPETAAIHLNESAVLRHQFGERFLSVFNEFFVSGTPHSVLKSLSEMPVSHERTSMVGFTSQLLHELKHYLDLVFTPYGFYRLRVAFEFYGGNIPHLLTGARIRLPVPLMSGSDPVNCRLLGLHEYAGTGAKKLSDLALNRARVIAFDNRKFPFEDGRSASWGGDAILEARAFNSQCEWLRNLLSEHCLRRFDLYFAKSTGTAFDLKYRWFTQIAAHLSPNLGISTARLTQCLLFAALCGAFARGAKYSSFELDTPVPASTGGRYVDDCLPSNRIGRLVKHFKQVGVPASSDWKVQLTAVDQACRSLWGYTATEEIEKDIATDEQFVEVVRTRRQPGDDDPFPILAFADLIDIRRNLLNAFREDPVPFVDYPGFVCHLGPRLSPQILRIHPQGLIADQMPQSPSVRTIHTETLSIPFQNGATGEKKVVDRHVIYANWRPSSNPDAPYLERHLPAWETVFKVLAPLYKGLLYGHRYRSMLEFDVVAALASPHLANRIVWDPDYYHTRDISSPHEYFDFYDLDFAPCDLCSRQVDRAGSVYISSNTIRQNRALLEHLFQNRNSVFVVYFLLQDKSGWLMCREEATQWGFIRSN